MILPVREGEAGGSIDKSSCRSKRPQEGALSQASNSVKL
jgi:hypothetical protein